MQRITRASKVLPLLCLGCGLGAAPALASPSYVLEGTIPITATMDNTDGGLFTAFDISYVDPSSHLYYLADRSNAAVDVFNTLTDTLMAQIGGSGHLFTGHQASSDVSGPDGVLVADSQLYAGNGNSTALVFNPLSPFTQLTTINTSITSPAADKRVDEMAFDPKDHRLLVVNDAATPHPYINLIDTTSNTVVQHTVLPTATAGIEQPFWDGATKKFYASIPQVGGAGAGGIAVVDPLTGAVTNIFDLTAFVASCGPTGLTGAGHGQLLVACGNKGTQAILLDVSSGSAVLVKLFPQVSGSDQAWFDPASDRFFVTGANNIGGPILGIIDGSNDTFLQALRTATGAHSVAVDPGGDLYVPVGAGSGNPFCPTTGCIAVFDVGVPEPGSLPLIVTAMAGLIGLGLRRRSHR